MLLIDWTHAHVAVAGSERRVPREMTVDEGECAMTTADTRVEGLGMVCRPTGICIPAGESIRGTAEARLTGLSPPGRVTYRCRADSHTRGHRQ